MADKKAAAADAPAEEDVDVHKGELGPTYLKVVEDRLGGAKKKLTSRVVYVGDITAGTSADKIAAHSKSVFGGSSSAVNGITLVYSDHVVGLIESTPAAAMEALRELGKDPGPLSGLRVVCSVEDCPAEFFSDWKCKHVTVPADAGASLDDLVYATYNMYNTMANIGKNKIDVENSGDLPTQEMIAAMSKSSAIQSLGEFLKVYDAPINVALESEKVWPLQPFVQY